MQNDIKCSYCGSVQMKLNHEGVFHPLVNEHGPFNLYVCLDCKSLTTYPLPSKELLKNFYQKFLNGMPSELREAREESSQNAIYYSYLNRISKKIPSKNFDWLEIGSGGGEFAQIFADKYPNSNGICVDFHPKPLSVTAPNINWIQKDINDPLFENNIKFDIIVSFAVLEHVLEPSNFVNNIIDLMDDGGYGLLICPDFSSLASKVLKTKWPYFSPGEHLSIPSVDGVKLMLNSHNVKYNIRRVSMPYTWRYMLNTLKFKRLSQYIPRSLTFPFPTGILAIEILKS